ncbi:MAG: GNAT family N-acetyltransferase [Pseudomonadota bacterium]
MTALEIVDRDEAVFDGLLARFEEENGLQPFWSRQSFAVVRRGAGGQIEAGGRGVLNMGLVEIRVLWVAEALRGQGIGRAILAAIEAEAHRRGARRAALDTYSWQAEGFYIRLGYRVWGRLPYPAGAERIHLSKDLTGGPNAACPAP